MIDILLKYQSKIKHILYINFKIRCYRFLLWVEIYEKKDWLFWWNTFIQIDMKKFQSEIFIRIIAFQVILEFLQS